MVIFSHVFRKTATKRVRQTSENAGTGVKETKSVYAELEKAASLYAAQLEKATRELGYNLKDYEEAGAR